MKSNMKHLKNWEKFELIKTNEEFVNILPKLDNYKLLRGEKLVKFLTNIIPTNLLNIIRFEVSKYSKVGLSENIESNIPETEKSEIVDTLSKSQEIENTEDIKDVLLDKGIKVDDQVISTCKDSISKISDTISNMNLNLLSKKFLKIAALCVFFFYLSSDVLSQSQVQATDTTKVQTQKTSGFKTKLLMSSTTIDCFEYERDGAYHIVEVPELSKKDLKLQLEKNINELRLKVQRNSLGNISQIKYNTWSPDEIRGDIQFKISPMNRNGVTEAQFVIHVKDGKYKAQIINVKFVEVGQQRLNSPQFSDPIRNPERYQREIQKDNERWSKSKRVRKECDNFFLSLLSEFNSSQDF